MAETKTAVTQSEVTANAIDSSPQQPRRQKAFKFFFLICIAVAMTGWLSFLAWVVWSLLGF